MLRQYIVSQSKTLPDFFVLQCNNSRRCVKNIFTTPFWFLHKSTDQAQRLARMLASFQNWPPRGHRNHWLPYWLMEFLARQNRVEQMRAGNWCSLKTHTRARAPTLGACLRWFIIIVGTICLRHLQRAGADSKYFALPAVALGKSNYQSWHSSQHWSAALMNGISEAVGLWIWN